MGESQIVTSGSEGVPSEEGESPLSWAVKANIHNFVGFSPLDVHLSPTALYLIHEKRPKEGSWPGMRRSLITLEHFALLISWTTALDTCLGGIFLLVIDASRSVQCSLGIA